MNSPLAAAAAGIAGIPASAIGMKPSLHRILSAIRQHMGMDVAFVSEFLSGRRVFRHVDADDSRPTPIAVGGSDPAEESYCLRVVDGRLPELIPDACLNAEALTLQATLALPVGAHMSVPIRLADGHVYGTFCCFSYTPDATLTARDLGVMRVFADMVGQQIQDELDEREAKRLVDHRIDAVLNDDGLRIVYQPIFDVGTHRVVGFEALSRFAAEPYRAPDIWFAEAALAGRAIELETRAIRLAVSALAELPPSVYVAVNASPETIVSGRLAELLHGLPLDRIVLEVTEHQAIEHYEDIAEVVEPLRERGLCIAIDDAGAGYASFRHILNLHPHVVKLDISITRAIDTDRSRRALAAALCGFASETGCKIVAEGVETEGELEVIRALGISRAQGFFLGRPMSVDDGKALAASR
ncbi:sensor domain-containing phosphodiesterase [Roseateles sp.]|uniref:sensor domain-containing phosphodiesterase n=1 Tax=Roseateles sp. TaxID=1971397 RepID=UPI003BA89CAA